MILSSKIIAKRRTTLVIMIVTSSAEPLSREELLCCIVAQTVTRFAIQGKISPLKTFFCFRDTLNFIVFFSIN